MVSNSNVRIEGIMDNISKGGYNHLHEVDECLVLLIMSFHASLMIADCVAATSML